MIRLDTTNRTLQLYLGGAHVTAPLQIVVSYSDQTSTTYLGGTQLTNSNGTTAVTICSAPSASTIRDIDMVSVLNTDTASQVVTIKLVDTSTDYLLSTVTLLVGEKLTYTHGSAWQVVDNTGSVKYVLSSSSSVTSFSAGSTGLTPATATTGVVTLGGTLAVANGGTGVTISTGTGNNVLSTSPTLTTPTITALDTQFTLQDNVDPTKQALFELSAITTATTGTYTLPAATTTLAGLGTSQTFSATNTFSNTTTFSGNVSNTSSSFTRTATTQAWLDGSMTTAAWTVGGTAQTGIITLGRSTAAQTLNIATGATATATTKTLNIGTAGLSGSTTAISIGSAVSGATTTTNAYGAWTFNTAIDIASGGTGQTTTSAAFNALSPITTTGDLILGNGTNSATRLGIGASTYVLTSNGTTASWAASASGGISTGKSIAMAMIFGF